MNPADDWFLDLMAAVVRQSLRDYRDGYHHPKVPDAAAFLTALGWLTPDGLDKRVVGKYATRKPQETTT